MTKINQMRKKYEPKIIHRTDLDSNPIVQFENWFNDALAAQVPEPNAMVLATVDANQHPSARIMLLKSFDENGFVFFTNYSSRKANALNKNSYGALVFWWQPLTRQVRIEGKIKKVDAIRSDEYFSTRSKDSNVSAYASPQSQVIENREVLIKRFDELTQQYRDVENVPRPDNWGGYILEPDLIEFWSGSEHRLHDRFQYSKDESGEWIIQRLAP